MCSQAHSHSRRWKTSPWFIMGHQWDLKWWRPSDPHSKTTSGSNHKICIHELQTDCQPVVMLHPTPKIPCAIGSPARLRVTVEDRSLVAQRRHLLIFIWMIQCNLEKLALVDHCHVDVAQVCICQPFAHVANFLQWNTIPCHLRCLAGSPTFPCQIDCSLVATNLFQHLLD